MEFKESQAYKHVAALLDAKGVFTNSIDETPPGQIRDVMRRAFPKSRMFELQDNVIVDSLKMPLLNNLLVTRIGYGAKLKGHYIPRPSGSLDHIMFLCVRGTGYLQIEDTIITIPQDNIVIIPANTPHKYWADGIAPWSLFWIHFTGNEATHYFDWLDINALHPMLNLPYDETVLKLFETIYGYMDDIHSYDNLVMASIHFTQLIGRLREIKQASSVKQQLHDEMIKKCISHMKKHISEDILLSELAKKAKLSVNRFIDIFKEKTAYTPIDYLIQLRIQRARELLLGTDMKVLEIAKQIGYNDPYYFSRIFKKVTGTSPREFKKQSQSEE